MYFTSVSTNLFPNSFEQNPTPGVTQDDRQISLLFLYPPPLDTKVHWGKEKFWNFRVENKKERTHDGFPCWNEKGSFPIK